MQKWRRYILLLFALLSVHASFSQNTIPARFPGGDTAWNKYLDSSFNNRSIAAQMTAKDFERFGKTQKVTYSFLILTDGSIGSIIIDGQCSQAVRNEINRILKTAPKWSPAILNGQPSTFRKRQTSTFVFE